jgi:hypothetical protein
MVGVVAVALLGEVGAELEYADAAYFLEHAQFLEDRHVRRQQRFADMKTRVVLLFQLQHAEAAPLQQRRRRRPGRAAADHEHIATDAVRSHPAACIVFHVPPSVSESCSKRDPASFAVEAARRSTPCQPTQRRIIAGQRAAPARLPLS